MDIWNQRLIDMPYLNVRVVYGVFRKRDWPIRCGVAVCPRTSLPMA